MTTEFEGIVILRVCEGRTTNLLICSIDRGLMKAALIVASCRKVASSLYYPAARAGENVPAFAWLTTSAHIALTHGWYGKPRPRACAQEGMPGMPAGVVATDVEVVGTLQTLRDEPRVLDWAPLPGSASASRRGSRRPTRGQDPLQFRFDVPVQRGFAGH